MEAHPELWTILKSFHRPEDHPMISWDSQKIRFMDTGRPLSKISKATKPNLTQPHRDVYVSDGVLIDRIQAMIIHQDPDAIALGFVLFSHDSEIQRLTSLLLTKKMEGFSTIKNERLIEIIKPYWRSPLKGFVVWKQETVHFEGIPNTKVERSEIKRSGTERSGTERSGTERSEIERSGTERKLLAFDQTPATLCRFSYRIVIGTHVPIGLTREMLTQLAYLSEQGWCPEIYLKNKPNNRGTNVAKNVVNRKTTQYMISREITPPETISLQNINYTAEAIDRSITELSPIIREFYGIY